ncbi:hypothetical protein [Deinococcus sp. UYEF24]
MKSILVLAALLTGAASAALSRPPPVLCRVSATSERILFPPLRSITLSLRPECPENAHAYVRLHSETGATDPLDGSFRELTRSRPTLTFNGVLTHWRPEWQAASGRTYTVPENSP